MYFVTICTKNQQHFFGEIVRGEMQYTEIGLRAIECWKDIGHLHDFVTLDECVVMPNHIHGIIFIHQNVPIVETCQWHVSTAKFGHLQKQSLSSIINQFKGCFKKWSNNAQIKDFEWQKKFHDRIIRNTPELDRIRAYIFHNPLTWESDKNNSDQLWI
jgi:REP element-mobilizing transposase RayT